jgi:hypothetical protein
VEIFLESLALELKVNVLNNSVTKSRCKHNACLVWGLFAVYYFANKLITMKNQVKNTFAALGFAALTAFTVSCDKDETKETVVVDNGNKVTLTSNITSNTTWVKDSVYVLATRVIVESGAELTIEAGTVIKGQTGAGANATALVISRGAKIYANGTATEPIIFTAVADEIESGMIVSPNLNEDFRGLWGGLIVLGNAKASLNGNVTESAIEGIPATDNNGKFGGNDDTDNSGVIRYVSIRHGGTDLNVGDEINGLTLGAVGSGTVIENVEVVANKDDGIEWFGGTVNVKNLIIWNAGDDGVDTDMAWAGTLDNFVVINSGDKSMELDGPEGAYAGAGHTITNGNVYADDCSGLIDYDANTDVNITNVYFTNLKAGQTMSDFADYSANGNGFASSAFEATLPDATSVTDFFTGGSDAITTVVTLGNKTVGADLSVLTSWSWAGQSGKF